MKRILLVMSWLLPAVALAQPGDLSKVRIKATHVAGNVHMLEGAGGNIGVSVGPDGVLIVDDQFAPLAPKIREALGKLARGKVKTKGQVAVEYVLNTHWHLDHTGGNAVISSHGSDVNEFGYRQTISVGKDKMTIDSWALSAKVDFLRTVLAGGFPTHLAKNETVQEMI